MVNILCFSRNQLSRFLYDDLRESLADETVCSILISNELSIYETEYQLVKRNYTSHSRIFHGYV